VKSAVRRILAMVVRVLDFIRINPSTETGYNSLVSRLEERLKRADALAAQEREGQLAEREAIARRKELRRNVQLQQLRTLVLVAQMAAKDRPELAGQFVLPPFSVPHKTFLTAAREMLARALAEKELFVSLGLGESFLDELGKAVAEFDGATQTAHEGRSKHVGARADLSAVTDECMDLVVLLDGLNRVRFRDDPEKLAAWESARNVVGPFRSRSSDSPSDGGVIPRAPGGVAPAA